MVVEGLPFSSLILNLCASLEDPLNLLLLLLRNIALD